MLVLNKGKKRPIGYITPGGYKKTAKGWVKVKKGRKKKLKKKTAAEAFDYAKRKRINGKKKKITDKKSASSQPYKKAGILLGRADISKLPDYNYVPHDLKKDLRDHQLDSVNLFMQKYDTGMKNVSCFDGTGAGKTRQQIALAETYMEHNKKAKVLIITENDRIMVDSFAKDGKAMGVSMTAVKTADQLTSGSPGTYITTYRDLNNLKAAFDEVDLSIYDESHNLKNATISKKAKVGIKLIQKSKHTAMFTATPVDKAQHMMYLCQAYDLNFKKVMKFLGFKRKGNHYYTNLKYSIIAQRYDAIFRELTKKGLIVKREVPLDGMTMSIKTVELTDDYKSRYNAAVEKMQKQLLVASPKRKGLLKAQWLMKIRALLEESKIQEAVNTIEDSIAKGKQVVLFADRVSDSMLKDAKKQHLTKFTSGTLKQLASILEKKGIKFAEVYGSKKDAADDIKAFQAGTKQVLITTPKSGGPQPLYSKILTPTGWTTMGDIQIGDKVIAVDGTISKVVKTFDVGNRDIYELVMTSGSRARCSLEHLWKVRSHQYRGQHDGWQIVSLQELLHRKRLQNYRLPVNKIVPFNEQETLVDPYTLGLLLGDGTFCRSSPGYASADRQLLKSIEDFAAENNLRFVPDTITDTYISGSISSTDRNNQLTRALRMLNLWQVRGDCKFIPEQHLFNTGRVRLEILRGLMDTNGSIDLCGNTEFSTTSFQLAKDVAFITRSLGGTATIRCQKFHWRTRTKREFYYRVGVNVDLCPFKLKRKVDRWHKPKYRKNNIKEVNKVDNCKCKCILIDHPTHLYITDNFIVTHNTGISLDDVTGKKPRVAVVMTPPFSAVDFIQMPGRVHRLTTKSKSEVVMLSTDTPVEEWNKNIIANKLITLGASVKGEYAALSVKDLQMAETLPPKEAAKFLAEKKKQAKAVPAASPFTFNMEDYKGAEDMTKSFLYFSEEDLQQPVQSFRYITEQELLDYAADSSLTSQYGNCPHCGCEYSEIVWGWQGSYYDLKCTNGHSWTYTFPVRLPTVGISLKSCRSLVLKGKASSEGTVRLKSKCKLVFCKGV